MDGAGKNPLFNEQFQFQVASMQDQLVLEVYEKNTFSSDLIGVASILIQKLCSQSEHQVQIKDGKGAAAGTVQLQCAYVQILQKTVTANKEQNTIKIASEGSKTVYDAVRPDVLPTVTSGKLQLFVIEAKLTRDTEIGFNKMDPFATLQYREQTFKTKVMQGAGKTPVWNETFEVDVKYIGDNLTLRVMDEDVTTSDTVGEAIIKLSALCMGGGIDEWFEIQFEGKTAGKVHLKGIFTADLTESQQAKVLKNGKLKLTVKEAQLSRDTEAGLDKMDPFVSLKYREQCFRTKVLQGAGKSPVWDETFDLDIKYVGDDIELQLFDEDVTTNDSVGKATIKVSTLTANGGIDEWFEIHHKGKIAGKVRLVSQIGDIAQNAPTQKVTSGLLKLTIIEASLSRDTEIGFNKMDPFATLQYREQTFKTKVMQGAGKTPVWNETFEVDVKYIGDNLTLRVMDEDLTTSDTVGEAVIKLSALCIHGLDDWFEVQYKGKIVGKVHIKTEFTASDRDESTCGKLTLEVREAQLTRDTDSFGSMEPFVQIQLREQSYKTKQKQGKMPTWGESFEFDVKYIGDLLKVSVWDKDATYDDQVGEIAINVSSVCANGGVDEWFEIYHKGKQAGKVHIVSKYTGENKTSVVEKKQEIISGILKLTVKDAKLTRDTEILFNKMDPFVALQYREQFFKTKVHQGGGKTPVWNETFEIDVKYVGDDLKLEVLDQDVTTSDSIGMAQIKFSALVTNKDDWYEVSYKGQVAGTVHLVTEFTPKIQQELSTKGYLQLVVVEAELSRDTDLIGKMDPFVKLQYREQSFKTKVASGAGKQPKFNETFQIDVKYIGDDLTIGIYDEDAVGCDKVGETCIKLQALVMNGGIDEWFTVQHKGATIGKIHLVSSYGSAEAKNEQTQKIVDKTLSGQMKLTVVEAKLTRDTETFTKMDPFVELKLREQTQRTKVLKSAGKTPVWDETFDLDIKYIGDDLQLDVLDEDIISNERIGSAIVKVSALCTNGGVDEWFQVQFKGKVVGQVHLRSQFTASVRVEQEQNNVKLKLTVKEAQLSRDTEAGLNKMDPFVSLKYREQCFRTKVLQGAGKSPVWDETFDLDIKYVGDDIELQLFDEDVTTNDPVGKATIKVSALTANGGIDEWFEIQHVGKVAGKVRLVSQSDSQKLVVNETKKISNTKASGKLKLTVKDAKLTRDTEILFNKMDPFVALQYREQFFKTKVHQGGGKTPVWNETFEIDVKYVGDDLKLEVCDQDVTTSDLIGIATIKMTSLVEGTDQWFEISYKGKPAGKVHLLSQFTPDKQSISQTETGQMKLTVVAAKLTRDTETFTKMDPFVELKLREQTLRTKVLKSAGKTPVWDETFDLDIKYVGDDLQLDVLDEDIISNERIGSAIVKVSALCTNGGVDEWFEVQFKGKVVGQVHLRSMFIKRSGSAIIAPDTKPIKGSLQFTIVEAKLTRDTEVGLNQMDPFATVKYRDQAFRTKVQQGKGKQPQWNETFTLDVKYIGDDLVLTVYDEDTMSNDKVGEVSIKLSALCLAQGLDDWFQIQFEGKVAGTVHVKAQFTESYKDDTPSTGKLRLTVKEAQLSRDTEMLLNKMDPFATVKYRQQDYKTKVNQGAGKNPVWNETFEIDVKYQGDDLVLKIFDEDVICSDLVGTGTIKVQSLCGSIDEWFNIEHRGKPAGKVHLICEFESKDGRTTKPLPLSGTLDIKVVEATLIRDTEMILNRMDPFVQLKSREQSFQTKALQGAGKTPVWNEDFQLQVKYIGDDLTVSVLDEDVVSHDVVGSCQIKFTGLVYPTDQWYELQHQGKSAGRVHLITKFTENVPKFEHGDLQLTVIEAQLARDTELGFNKMDPFCRLEYREQSFKTKVMQGAGKNPVWNEAFTFYVKYAGDDLRVYVLDEDTVSSDRIGEATIKMAALCLNGGIDEWFEIQDKGKPAGKIHLRGKFTPKLKAVPEKPQSKESLPIVQERKPETRQDSQPPVQSAAIQTMTDQQDPYYQGARPLPRFVNRQQELDFDLQKRLREMKEMIDYQRLAQGESRPKLRGKRLHAQDNNNQADLLKQIKMLQDKLLLSEVKICDLEEKQAKDQEEYNRQLILFKAEAQHLQQQLRYSQDLLAKRELRMQLLEKELTAHKSAVGHIGSQLTSTKDYSLSVDEELRVAKQRNSQFEKEIGKLRLQLESQDYESKLERERRKDQTEGQVLHFRQKYEDERQKVESLKAQLWDLSQKSHAQGQRPKSSMIRVENEYQNLDKIPSDHLDQTKQWEPIYPHSKIEKKKFTLSKTNSSTYVMSEPKHVQKHRLLVSAHERSARKTNNTELQELKMTLWSIEPRYVRLATTALRTRHEREERDALKLYVDELKAKISQMERD